MTNLQSLSVFVTERLTLAAQEIFKAVEVTVTEYHEEISRSRQENELLKRRLLDAGIDFYSELQPSLSVVQERETSIGQSVCGEPWDQQSEKIQVKLELSAAQEETQDSQPQMVMCTESVSPKPCLQNEQKMEEMFHAQATESSMDTLLPPGTFMQIKEEPGELVPDLRLETFCESQTSISADPSSAVGSSHCIGFEDELDSHRLSSVHKAVRSKMHRRKRRRLEVPLSIHVDAVSERPVSEPTVGKAICVCTTERTFLVESLLKSCNFKGKRRYQVGLEEIKRRIGPPEFMSLNALVSYLRTSKSNKESLKKELTNLGVVPPLSTRLTSLCSKLTEDEAQDLAMDLGKLARHIDFKSAAEPQRSSENKTTELMRAKSFWEFLKKSQKALTPCMDRYDTVTHGLGPKTFDVAVQIIEAYVMQVIKRLT